MHPNAVAVSRFEDRMARKPPCGRRGSEIGLVEEEKLDEERQFPQRGRAVRHGLEWRRGMCEDERLELAQKRLGGAEGRCIDIVRMYRGSPREPTVDEGSREVDDASLMVIRRVILVPEKGAAILIAAGPFATKVAA